MLEDYVVMNGYITGGLICYMYVMALLGKSDECTSHRNHIVVRMWGEDDNLLRERI